MDAMEQVKPEQTDRTAALEQLLSAVRARSDEFTGNQQISTDVVEMMKAAGVYRAMVAKRFGGDEKSPADFLRLIETISKADGSAGWVASFGFSAVYLSALPVETLQAMYANGPDVVFAGGIFPPQKAIPVPGGLEVSGRWSWGSGCTGADVIGVGIKVEGGGPTGGLPLIAVMPAEKVRIVPNWDVIGMKGTGSHDMTIDKVVVPEAWTFVRGGKSSLDTPLYRYPSMPLAAQVLAVVGLGIARTALDQMIGLAGGRTSITGQPTLADRPYVQTDIAKAEAALRSARAFFYEITEEAYATLVAGDDLSVETRALLRLASTNAARVAADITLDIYRIGGTTGVFADHWIARLMQDAQIIPQHAFLADTTWQNAGKVLLGLESPPGFP
ncbi:MULTISPECIES: acyl-CoA dehydrogenase family protein [unclassified Sphingomonas]|uniref:acyl-CoA dehydrogenase family protein n=1 Tax=unclassified Sphingomonas TaxID=196159 RepID=UPI0006F66C64|nr:MULTISPECIES: acyl-CoA dehydrogenase family protein [unclassified Sphingomonas]KQX18670.1 acyl-CoA dehydrogenase [Sphingomonas sp. Root1294]KQY72007.1 acyl-CoA dehydrogenase [Sphingomonas sp. Root50]KRB94726.1 acyl-CoA dehydrogenase [Sphingomonas sp. Root720]